MKMKNKFYEYREINEIVKELKLSIETPKTIKKSKYNNTMLEKIFE